MAITSSLGYGGSINEGAWARMADLLGGTGVAGLAHLRVTAGGTGDRAVTVATGTAFGDGIVDICETTTNLNAASVPSGVRWDTVAVRRNWQGAGGSSSLVVIQGGSAQALAPLNDDPGVLADYPLALIRCNAGQAAVQQVVDLRVRPTKHYIADSAVGLDVPGALTGSLLTVPGGTNEPARLYSRAGSGVFVPVDDPPWSSVPAVSGVTSHLAYRLRGGMVELDGSMSKTSGGWPVGSVTLGTLPAEARPPSNIRVPVALAGSATDGGPAVAPAELRTTGTVLLYNTVTGTGSAFFNVAFRKVVA